jgi:hypothetical protein
MSADAAPRRVRPGLEDHGLRLTLSVMAALLAGLCWDNPLVALIAPLLTAVLMAPAAPAPSAARIIAAPVVIWLVCGAIAGVATLLAQDDAVLLLLLGTAVFLCFRSDAVNGPSPLTGLLLILIVTVAPTSAVAGAYAGDLVEAMAWGVLIAMLGAALAHVLLPVRRPAAAAAARAFSPDRGLRTPLVKTLLLMVLVAWFVLTDKTNALYILVTATTVLRMPASTSLAAGLVLSNFVGGALAICIGGLALAISSDLFTLLAFAAMILVLGLTIEGGGNRGLIAQGAVSAAIILFALTVMPVDGSSAYVQRVLEVAATMLYVILGRAAFASASVRSPRRQPA